MSTDDDYFEKVLLILACFCSYFPTLHLLWRMKIINLIRDQYQLIDLI